MLPPPPYQNPASFHLQDFIKMADLWTPDFFKILLHPFAHHLPLPHAFVSKHYLKHKIPNNPTTTLESATGGHSWKVKIEKIGGSYCFTHGWNNVVRDARLGCKDLLVFKLVRQSTFRVSVFSPSGCERYLPTSIIKIDDDDDDDDDDEVDGDDDDDDGDEDEEEDDGEDPFFTTTISKTHKCILRLPSKFVEMAGIGEQKVITVKNVDGREWRLGLRSEKSDLTERYYLSPGWNEFRRSNELSEGDECLFKYIQNEGKLCLVKVSPKKSVAKTPTTEVVKRKRGRPPKKSPMTEEVKTQEEERGQPPAKIPVKRKRGRPFKDRGGVPSGTR